MKKVTVLFGLIFLVHGLLSAKEELWNPCIGLDELSVRNIVELKGEELAVFASDGEKRMIYFSYDRGYSWDVNTVKTIPNAGGDASGIFTDRQHIWTFPGYQDTDYLLNSTDGGDTWSEISIPTNVQLTNLDYLNNDFIMVAGLDGTLIKTTDAGVTWEKIELNTTSELGDIEIVDEQKWFVTDYDNGLLLSTSDAGTTWETVLEGEGLYDIKGPNIFMHEDSQNIITVSSYSDKIYISTDKGVTWKTCDLSPDFVTPDDACIAVHFITEKIGVIGTWYSDIYYTVNGGDTWTCQLEQDDPSGFGKQQIWDIWISSYIIYLTFTGEVQEGFAAGDWVSFYTWGHHGAVKENQNEMNFAIASSIVGRGQEFLITSKAANVIVQQVEIYSTDGRLISRTQNSSNITAPNIAGIYFVKITSASGNVETGKILVR